MSQESVSTSSSRSVTEEEAAAPLPGGGPAASSSAQVSTGDLDDLLADIDSVLTANAEEFVKGFVQKGGQ